jgi:hypothetical protein
VIGVAFIVIGALSMALSRVFADAFKIPGDRSGFTRFLGMGDDYASSLLRWAIAMGVGLVFVVAGIAELAG